MLQHLSSWNGLLWTQCRGRQPFAASSQNRLYFRNGFPLRYQVISFSKPFQHMEELFCYSRHSYIAINSFVRFFVCCGYLKSFLHILPHIDLSRERLKKRVRSFWSVNSFFRLLKPSMYHISFMDWTCSLRSRVWYILVPSKLLIDELAEGYYFNWLVARESPHNSSCCSLKFSACGIIYKYI